MFSWAHAIAHSRLCKCVLAYPALTNARTFQLPCLLELDLNYNPFCYGHYRVAVLNLFREQRGGVTESIPNSNLHSLLLPTLDRVPANKRELTALKELTFASVVSVPVDICSSSAPSDSKGAWSSDLQRGPDEDSVASSSGNFRQSSGESSYVGVGDEPLSARKSKRKKGANRKRAQIEDSSTLSPPMNSPPFSGGSAGSSVNGLTSFSTLSLGVVLNAGNAEQQLSQGFALDAASPSKVEGRGGATDGAVDGNLDNSATATRRAARALRRSKMTNKMKALQKTINAIEGESKKVEQSEEKKKEGDNGEGSTPAGREEQKEAERTNDDNKESQLSPNSSVYFSPAAVGTCSDNDAGNERAGDDVGGDESPLIVVRAGELQLEEANGHVVEAEAEGVDAVKRVTKKKRRKKKKMTLRPSISPVSTKMEGNNPFDLDETGNSTTGQQESPPMEPELSAHPDASPGRGRNRNESMNER